MVTTKLDSSKFTDVLVPILIGNTVIINKRISLA